ncbi:MAG: matrixin family metalloprotease [Vicinamibacterales bacterium]
MPGPSSRGGAGAVVLVAVLAAFPRASAASLRVPADRVAAASAAAVRGQVVAMRAGWDGTAIYTYVTLDIRRQWGLPGAPRRVTVKQLGGTVGETALLVGGQARFAVGEDVLLFLEVRPRDRTLAVTALADGKWTSTADTAAMVRAERGLDPTARRPPERRALADLEALAAQTGATVSAADARLDAAMPADDFTVDAARFALLAPATPARWHEADSGTPVYVDADAAGQPQIPGGGIAEGMAAARLWSEAAALSVVPGGLRGPRCFSHGEPADGRISISYGDPCDEIADSSPTLAIGGAYFSASDVREVGGVPFWKITAGMIVLDGVAAKFAGMSRGCYADLVGHELGHAIGLGHAAAASSLMFPTLPPGCTDRDSGMGLGADDRAGALLLYPPPGPPPPGTPNGLGVAVSGATVTVFWGRPLWGTAPTAYRLEAGSAAGLSDQGAAIVNATSFIASGVPNGVYHLRVRALAGEVAGPATPDVRIAVGGPPPGPPSAVSYAVAAGGVVQLSWSPPAGAVTGYVVEVGLAPGSATHRFAVAGTTLAGAGVPSGTYYVRVVAMNGTAASVPSSEIALVVP